VAEGPAKPPGPASNALASTEPQKARRLMTRRVAWSSISIVPCRPWAEESLLFGQQLSVNAQGPSQTLSLLSIRRGRHFVRVRTVASIRDNRRLWFHPPDSAAEGIGFPRSHIAAQVLPTSHPDGRREFLTDGILRVHGGGTRGEGRRRAWGDGPAVCQRRTSPSALPLAASNFPRLRT